MTKLNKDPHDRQAKSAASDPIGPASVAVDVKQFLDYANSKAELWQGTSKTLIEAPFAALSANEKDALSERCSCEDLRNEAQAHWDDDALVTDLKLWQWARTYAGSDDNERLAQAVGDTPTAHKTIRSTSSGPAAKKRKGKKAEPEELLVGASDIVIDPSLQLSGGADGASPAFTDSLMLETQEEILPPPPPKRTSGYKKKRGPPASVVEPAVAQSIDPFKQNFKDSGLRILQPFPEAYSYLRRTRQSDYQSLSACRTGAPPVMFIDAEDPVAVLNNMRADGAEPEVLVFITFHPVPNRFPGVDKEIIMSATRLQRIIFLGSHTLADLRDAMVASSTAIPAERSKSTAAAANGDVAMEAEDADTWRYTTEKWQGGAVCSFEGRLYGDTRHGVTNYAQLIPQLIDEVDWPGAAFTGRGRRRRSHSIRMPDELDVLLEDNYGGEIDPTLMAPRAGSVAATGAARTQDDAPRVARNGQTILDYQDTGKTMQDTKFYDILGGIKLGEPYWFLQQGADEHIFVVDEIRMLHPSDPHPKLADYPDCDVYPITSFLSRLNVNKCAVCERDPATRVNVNDELAGQTPCPICDLCFEMLHVDEEGARANGVEVIHILEELGA